MFSKVGIFNRVKTIASVFTEELVDDELREFFYSELTLRLFYRWCEAEHLKNNLKSLKMFSFLIRDPDALENLSSHFPKEKKDRDYCYEHNLSFEDLWGIYGHTDIEFISLYELYDAWIEGNHDIIRYMDGHLRNVNRLDGSNGSRDIYTHLTKEADRILEAICRIKEILTEPMSLALEGVDSYRTADGNYGGVSYQVDNVYDKYLYDGHTHFRDAMTAHEPRQYLGTELVWDDTGHEVKKYSGHWLDKNRAESFKDLGRYNGRANKTPKGMFGGSLIEIK